MLKRIILAAFAAVCLAACQKSDGGGVIVRQDLDVTIKADGVLSGFTLFNSNDLYTTDKVKVSYYLYDPSGALSDNGSFQLDGFAGEETVSFTVTGTENYTLVALAHYIDSNSDSAFAISDYSTLESLTVQQLEYEGYGWTALGYAAVSINPVTATHTVKLQPANSLVYVSWDEIHSSESEVEYPLYGDYKATATDYWGEETYEWTITVEKGTSDIKVIVYNLDPFLVEAGFPFSDEHHVNYYAGTYDASSGTISIPSQSTGLVVSSTGDSIDLLGCRRDEEDGGLIIEDLVLNVGNGTLTTANMFGTYAEGGWYDLFNPGIVFTSQETPSGGGDQVDEYYTIFHSNDVMKFNGTTPVFSSTLGEVNNFGISLEPARFPSYDYIYDILFTFPGSFPIFGRAFSGSQKVDTPKANVNIQANKQYVYTFDCANFTMSYREGSYAGSKRPASLSKMPSPAILPEYDIPKATGTPVIKPVR